MEYEALHIKYMVQNHNWWKIPDAEHLLIHQTTKWNKVKQ